MSGNQGTWRLLFRNDGEEDFLNLTPEPSGPCLEAPPGGLGLPGTQTNDASLVERDGREMYSDTYPSRDLTFSIMYPNEVCEGCDSRQEVSEVLSRWARNCSDASLVISPDCADPSVPVLEDISGDPEERTLIGPYIVHGRPRAARVTHGPSNQGWSRIDFRFEGNDHKIGVIQPDLIDGSPSEITCLTLTADGTPQPAPNWGDTYSYPIVRLVGPLTGPIEINHELHVLAPVIFNGSVSDEVLIDFEARKAWEGDTDRTLDVTWGWRFLSAEHDSFGTDVWIETGNAADAGTAEFCYGTYVRGI